MGKKIEDLFTPSFTLFQRCDIEHGDQQPADGFSRVNLRMNVNRQADTLLIVRGQQGGFTIQPGVVYGSVLFITPATQRTPRVKDALTQCDRC